MAADPEEKLYADCRTLGIAHQVFEHEAVFTVEESRAIKTDIDCLHTKNLFLKDAGGAFFLLTVPAEARIDLKRVHPILHCRRLSFGKAEAMTPALGEAIDVVHHRCPNPNYSDTHSQYMPM